jgi:hypothetical protein
MEYATAKNVNLHKHINTVNRLPKLALDCKSKRHIGILLYYAYEVRIGFSLICGTKRRGN